MGCICEVWNAEASTSQKIEYIVKKGVWYEKSTAYCAFGSTIPWLKVISCRDKLL